MVFFFNRIITADISALVRFYYIFVVILQALNFGPQLSWQSSLKTSVLSYSPSSAPAESWQLKMLQHGVLFATEKVLIPDPNRSVNIYCLDVSTGPTPVGPYRHPGARPSSSRKQHICPQAHQVLSSVGRQHAGGSTPALCHSRELTKIPCVSRRMGVPLPFAVLASSNAKGDTIPP